MIHSVFSEQIKKWGRCVISSQMLRAGYVLSIDTVVSLDGDGATLRVSLTFPVTEQDIADGLSYREYVDSRGETRRVNSGGYRCTLQVDPDLPGFDLLKSRHAQGFSGNVGVPGPQRLFLLPGSEDAGVVFDLVERVNPVTGEAVIGLSNVALVKMRIGPLTVADNRPATAEDIEILRQAQLTVPAPAAPAPAAPAARPAPAGQAAPRSRFAR